MVLRTCNAAPSGARSGAGGAGRYITNYITGYVSIIAYCPGLSIGGESLWGIFLPPLILRAPLLSPVIRRPLSPASSRRPSVPVILRAFLPLSSWASSCPSHPGSFPASVILNLPGPCSSRQLRPCHPECLSPCHPEPPQPCHPERSEGSSLIPLQARRGNRRRGGKILRRCAPQDDRGETDAPRADKRGGRHPLRRQKGRQAPFEKTKGETVAPRADKRGGRHPLRRQKARLSPLEKTKDEAGTP